MDGADRRVLGMAAAHPALLGEHASALLDVDEAAADARLGQLVDAGLLYREWLVAGAAPLYRVTRAGLDSIESSLPAPALDLGRLRHDLAVAWLWMAAHAGAFGEVQRVRSPRELAVTGELQDADIALSVPAGLVVMHLLLSRPTGGWLERLLRRYGGDPRVALAMFLVDDDGVAKLVASVARGLELSEMTRVQRVTQADAFYELFQIAS